MDKGATRDYCGCVAGAQAPALSERRQWEHMMRAYQVSRIDKHGDAIDVDAEIASIREARRLADLSTEPPEIVATVIERYTSDRHGRREYETLELAGSREALNAGGWLADAGALEIKPDARKTEPAA